MNTCIKQLLVDLFIYRQVDVVVFLTTVGQVAVNGIVSRLEDSVFVVFQWLQGKVHSQSPSASTWIPISTITYHHCIYSYRSF